MEGALLYLMYVDTRLSVYYLQDQDKKEEKKKKKRRKKTNKNSNNGAQLVNYNSINILHASIMLVDNNKKINIAHSFIL